MSQAVSTEPKRQAREVISLARTLWLSGVAPDLIADALTAEFGKRFTGADVTTLAIRNEFPRATETARSGRQEPSKFLSDVDVKAQSASYLAALRAGCPLFNSKKANQ
jgi:hypothetical protein